MRIAASSRQTCLQGDALAVRHTANINSKDQTMVRVQIKSNEIDRATRILVDGKCICSTDYEESGWTGVELVENLARDMAKALKISFEKI